MRPFEFMREYETSGRTGGVERTLGLIADDAIYWFSDGSSHVGKAAIGSAIRRNLEAIKDETYRISEIVWVAQSADVAACAYRFDWSGVIEGPAHGEVEGRRVEVIEARKGSCHVAGGNAGDEGYGDRRGLNVAGLDQIERCLQQDLPETHCLHDPQVLGPRHIDREPNDLHGGSLLCAWSP